MYAVKRALAAGIVWLSACWLYALDVPGNQDLTLAPPLQGSGESITPSIVYTNITRPWPIGARQERILYYRWSDKDGNGSNQDATPNLVLGANRVFTDEGAGTNHLVLDLRTSAGRGTLTGSGGVSLTTCPDAAAFRSDLIIIGASIIDCGEISTHTETYTTYPLGAYGGDLTIGAATNPIVSLRADALRTGNPTYSDSRTTTHPLTIYAEGDVLVETSGGIPGDITTQSSGNNSGRVSVFHGGAFNAALLEGRTGCGYNHAASMGVILQGDWFDSGTSGACQVTGDINQFQTHTARGNANYGVHISGYASVDIGGSILTYNQRLGASGAVGGPINITNITGDIRIDGTIDAGADEPTASDGPVSLESAAGKIYVGNLDTDTVKWIGFNAGLKKSWFTGSLTNFAAGSDKIRTPIGQKVYYDPEICTWFSNQVFVLKALDGVSLGGQLRPVPINGTVVYLK